MDELSTQLNLPFVQSSQPILSIIIPLGPSLEIILIVQTTADGTSTGQMLADILPLHASGAQVDDQDILLGRPFGLLFGGRFHRRRRRRPGGGMEAFGGNGRRRRDGRDLGGDGRQ